MQFIEERIREILKQLEKLRFGEELPITTWQYAAGTEPYDFKDREKIATPNTFKVGERWGLEGKYYCFHTSVTVPKEMAGKPLQFTLTTGREGEWDATNPQFLLYVNGEIAQGLDVNHRDTPLGDSFKEGEEIDLFLFAYAGEVREDVKLVAAIRVMKPEIDRFYYDLLVPYQTACLQEKDEKIYWDILNPLNETVNLLDLRAVPSVEFEESFAKACAYLKENFYDACCGDYDAEVYCVGHTHIDVAWLWTLQVTREKAVRSFSTVVKLMETYPEYIFMSSQPQLYQYVKESAPEIYAKIKEYVAQGRWEVEGGTWVEPDCNIPSGESLVRQFLYGKRFFREEFGKDNEILWLPDVFGYSAALPQIMKKSGVNYFMTTKISWNETNKMPYDSFYWEGIDGTKVLSHFIPTRDYSSATRHHVTNGEFTTAFSTNYNGYTHPMQVKGAWQRYQQKDLNEEVLLSYGYGDGGGGTTPWMIETVERLNKALPGVPKTRFSTARDYFHTLEGKIASNRNTPVWTGELYLEYHRATYTSMARNKRYNRKAEFLLQDAEWLSVLSGESFREVIDQAWVAVLRNQFHDILPGSSIREVYETSKKEYEDLFAKVEPSCASMRDGVMKDIEATKGEVIVFNDNGTKLSGVATLAKEKASDAILPETITSQTTAAGDLLVEVADVPAKGYCTLGAAGCSVEEKMVSFTEREVENTFYRIRFNEKGQMTSFFDKEEERELLQAGKRGNVFMSYEDKPHDFDNWNLYEYYKEKSFEVDNLVSVKLTEKGPIRYAMELTYHYLSSVIVEKLYFYPDHRKVDMEMDIDWKEDQIFLKLLYPVQVYTKETTFEIQYGNVTRNMVKNTSWDNAKFEVCVHKWMDLSEGTGYGISFMNDCKFGVSVEDNVVGLSLIKAGMYPNPTADREHHHVLYSFYPHKGDYRMAHTVQEAYLLNHPFVLEVMKEHGERRPSSFSYLSGLPENMLVDVVKPAEDGNGTIVRMYEAYGERTKVDMVIPENAQEVYLENLLEMEATPLPVSDRVVSFYAKPFDILTFRFV